MISIRLLVIGWWGIFGFIFAQNPQVFLSDFRQLSFPVTAPEQRGNASLPNWSKSDQYVGVTFYDSKKQMNYVMIYDLVTGYILKYDTSIKGVASQQSPFGRKEQPRDTRHIVWSPSEESTFYVISRHRKTDRLFEAKLDQSDSGIQIVNTRDISLAGNDHIINFSLSNLSRNRFHILFSEGRGGNLDVFAYTFPTKKIIKKPIRRTEDVGEYDTQCFYRKDMIQFVFQGKVNNQGDIFFLQTPRLSGAKKSDMVNLTQTNQLGERNPRFNPSGNRIAYLRSDNLFVSQMSKEDERPVVYTLVIYDLQTDSEHEIYTDLFVTPDVFHQAPFIWLTDDLLLFIDNNFDRKFPLKAIDITTGLEYDILSPYMNHKELALSHSGKQLAFIAKGTNTTKDLSFDKLFVCDINIQ